VRTGPTSTWISVDSKSMTSEATWSARVVAAMAPPYLPVFHGDRNNVPRACIQRGGSDAVMARMHGPDPPRHRGQCRCAGSGLFTTNQATARTREAASHTLDPTTGGHHSKEPQRDEPPSRQSRVGFGMTGDVNSVSETATVRSAVWGIRCDHPHHDRVRPATSSSHEGTARSLSAGFGPRRCGVGV
jgi:hypothetical protein